MCLWMSRVEWEIRETFLRSIYPWFDLIWFDKVAYKQKHVRRFKEVLEASWSYIGITVMTEFDVGVLFISKFLCADFISPLRLELKHRWNQSPMKQHLLFFCWDLLSLPPRRYEHLECWDAPPGEGGLRLQGNWLRRLSDCDRLTKGQSDRWPILPSKFEKASQQKHQRLDVKERRGGKVRFQTPLAQSIQQRSQSACLGGDLVANADLEAVTWHDFYSTKNK